MDHEREEKRGTYIPGSKQSPHSSSGNNQQGRENGKVQPLPIEEAIEFLKLHLNTIDTVGEWSKRMGYPSASNFSNKFRGHFKVRPKREIIRMKKERAIELLSGSEDISCYEVALEIGKGNEGELNKFMNRHTGKPPTSYFSGSKNGQRKR